MMKKLVNLKGVKTLNRKQQQLVFGGLHELNAQGGSCAFVTYGGGGEIYVEKNVSRETARSRGDRWCCASCSSASWINSCNVCP